MKKIILTLGEYPMIKKWHECDNHAKYGYIVLKELNSELLLAESAFHEAIGLGPVKSDALSKFMTVVEKYAIDANFPKWRDYIQSFNQ